MKRFKNEFIFILVMAVIYFVYAVTNTIAENPSIAEGLPNLQLYLVIAAVLATIFKVFLIMGIILAIIYIVVFLYSFVS